LEQQIFFLLNYGQGYTAEDVRNMPVYTRHWHVNELSKKLKREAEAREDALRKR
jgi:hypothetical protein